jgi:hypothetical protein
LQREELKGKKEMIEDYNENVYTVEAILDENKIKGINFYEVKWEGFKNTTWEPLENLIGSSEVIKAYEETKRKSIMK